MEEGLLEVHGDVDVDVDVFGDDIGGMKMEESEKKQDFMEVYIYITSFLSIVKVTV